MSSREDNQLKRVLHAYHEAGHAVVWHVDLEVWLRKSLSPRVRPVTRDIAALVFSFLKEMTIPRLMSGCNEVESIPGRSQLTMPGCSLWRIIVPHMEERTTIKRVASGTIWRKSIACFCVSVLRNRSVRPYEMHAGWKHRKFSQTIGRLFKRWQRSY